MLNGTIGVFIGSGEGEEEIAAIPASRPGHMALVDGKRKGYLQNIIENSDVG